MAAVVRILSSVHWQRADVAMAIWVLLDTTKITRNSQAAKLIAYVFNIQSYA